MQPERTGEMTHEAMMPERPPKKLNGKGLPSDIQLRQPKPFMPSLPTSVMPRTPATMAWVVETGIFAKVARMRKKDAAIRADIMPMVYAAMPLSQ